jgi:photosystem II stability/assembly factor-like uncharacterized protein
MVDWRFPRLLGATCCALVLAACGGGGNPSSEAASGAVNNNSSQPGSTIPVTDRVELTGIAATPARPRPGGAVKFTPAGKFPNGTTYVWDFGDGSKADNNLTPAHVYATAGTYSVRLTATDQTGHTNSLTQRVTIEPNKPPEIASIAYGNSSPVAGQSVALFVQATDPDGDSLAYTWRVDGVMVAEDNTDGNLTYSFSTSGTHVVRVTVSDGRGGTDTLTTNVAVLPDPTTPPVRPTWQKAYDAPAQSKIRFFEDGAGWTVSFSKAEARHTTDNGATWQVVTLPRKGIDSTSGFYGVAFANKLKGMIVGCGDKYIEDASNGMNLYFNGGRALHTTDGGKTWNAIPIAGVVSDPACLLAVEFVGQKGWIVDDAGTVFGSNDGGDTWNRLSESGMRVGRMQFVDSQHGWIVGASHTGSSDSVARTTDGGMTWQFASVPAVPSSELSQPSPPIGISPGGLRSPWFVDQRTGYLSGYTMYDSTYAVYKTIDGGLMWTLLKIPKGSQTKELQFVDASTGYALDELGPLYKTTDGGMNWEPVLSSPPGASALTSFALRPQNTVWAVTALSEGGIFKVTLP